MSNILQMHFADPDDVKFEEFYDFFCTDVSNKTKNNLYDVYEKIRGDKDEVSFEDIARYYCDEDYESLISILGFLTSASERLEEIYNRKELTNEDFIPNMVEKILYYDIGLRLRGFYDSLLKINQIINTNIKKVSKESELGAKIKDILSTFKQSPAEQQTLPKEFSPSEKNQSFSRVDELQKRLNDFQREIDTLRTSSPTHDARFDYGEFPSQERDRKSETWTGGFEKAQAGGIGIKSDFLTGHVWPKSRMLLAIVSKMSKEGLLNAQQKGVLKDLIIEDDPRIMQCLKQYEVDGNRKSLYKNCLHLATTARFE